MAQIRSSAGLVMNMANTNQYVRYNGTGKNDVGNTLRITIGNGNPILTVVVRFTVAFTQTNGSFDFNSAFVAWAAFNVNTGGGMYGMIYSNRWQSGASIDFGYNFATRQADLWIAASSNGGFPGKSSVLSETVCNDMSYVTVSVI